MSVSARFIADFTSFNAAVDKAEFKLTEFRTASGKVESALQRMGDSFSGKKILSDASLAVRAVEQLGGVSKLTASEQGRLNSIVTEAIAKYQALGQQAPANMVAIEKATRQTESVTGQLSTRMVALGSAIGTAIGNIATDAFRSVGTALSQAVKDGQKFSQLSVGFEALSKSVGETKDSMLSMTRSATKGLISDLDLMQSTNKAVLLGLPVTAQEMGKLAQTAVTLGRAMGQDATASLNDLITALGRSSPLILDNLGLTVKAGEANEKYARQLGKSSNELTEAEKKMAFYNAAMEAAEKKTSDLGDVQLTVTDQVNRLTVAIGNMVTRIAASVNEGGELVSLLGRLAGAAERAAGNVNTLMEASKRLNQSVASLVTSPTGGFKLFDATATIEFEKAIQSVQSPLKNIQQPLLGAANITRDWSKNQETLVRQTDKLVESLSKKLAPALLTTKEQMREMAFGAATLFQGMAADISGMTSKIEPALVSWNAFVEKQPLNLDKWENALFRLPPALKSIGVEIEKTVAKSGGFFDSLKGGFGKLFEGGLSGFIGKVGTGIAEGFGNLISGGLSSLIGGGINLLGKGLGKLFSGLFGGEGKKVNDLRDAAFGAAGGFDALNEKAAKLGFTLDSVLRVNKVKDWEKAWGDLQVKFDEAAADQERLTAAIEKYGFSLEELGPKLQQQKLHEQATELIEDWRVLVGAGIDVAAVNEKMAATINDYLQKALRVGAEVPAAMKPILEAMAQQGTLVDENGEAITDLGKAGIKFSESMTQGFDRVVKKLDELISRLQATGSAISSIPNRTIEIEERITRSVRDEPSQSEAGFAHGTRGRYLNFGTGTPVTLHGRERVMTESEGMAEGMGWSAVQGEVAALRRDITLVLPSLMESAARHGAQTAGRRA